MQPLACATSKGVEFWVPAVFCFTFASCFAVAMSGHESSFFGACSVHDPRTSKGHVWFTYF